MYTMTNKGRKALKVFLRTYHIDFEKLTAKNLAAWAEEAELDKLNGETYLELSGHDSWRGRPEIFNFEYDFFDFSNAVEG